MAVDWKNKKDLDNIDIIKRINSLFDVSENMISDIRNFDDYLMILADRLKFNKEISETEQQRIVREVVTNSSYLGRLTEKNLFSEVTKLQRNLLAHQPKTFRFLTKISWHWTNEMPKTSFETSTSFDRVYVTFQPKKLGRRMLQEYERVVKFEEERMSYELPVGYVYVQVTVKARREEQAINIAIDALDLMRGVWNLRKNDPRRSTAGERTPVNKIVLDSIGTIHEDGVEKILDVWWHDPQYHRQIRPLKLKKGEFAGLRKDFHYVKERLNSLEYSQDIEQAILRYVRALDSTNWEFAFLKLWSILEMLTNTEWQGHDETVKRTAFIFPDADRHRKLLDYLRSRRNQSVHNGMDSENIESLVYKVKRYVEQLILFHLKNPFKFATKGEAGEFLESGAKLGNKANVLREIEKHKQKIKRHKQIESFLS